MSDNMVAAQDENHKRRQHVLRPVLDDLKATQDGVVLPFLTMMPIEDHLMRLTFAPLSFSWPESLRHAFNAIPAEDLEEMFGEAVSSGDLSLTTHLLEARGEEIKPHFSMRYLLAAAPDLAMTMLLLHYGAKARPAMPGAKGTIQCALDEAIFSENFEKAMLFEFMQAIDPVFEAAGPQGEGKNRGNLLLVVSAAMLDYDISKQNIEDPYDRLLVMKNLLGNVVPKFLHDTGLAYQEVNGDYPFSTILEADLGSRVLRIGQNCLGVKVGQQTATDILASVEGRNAAAKAARVVAVRQAGESLSFARHAYQVNAMIEEDKNKNGDDASPSSLHALKSDGVRVVTSPGKKLGLVVNTVLGREYPE